jgi:hypothetical protein
MELLALKFLMRKTEFTTAVNTDRRDNHTLWYTECKERRRAWEVANGVQYNEVKRIIWTLMASGGKFKEEDAVLVNSCMPKDHKRVDNSSKWTWGT